MDTTILWKTDHSSRLDQNQNSIAKLLIYDEINYLNL